MKIPVLAALFCFFIAGAAAAAPPGFDLRLDQKDGARLIAVANVRTGAFAVAAGGASLDLLEGDAAQKAFDKLNAFPDLDLGGDEVDAERGASGKRKIIVHKMDYEEDQSGDSDEADTVHLSVSPGDCAPGDRTNDRRLIYINGADADAAGKFIDKLSGLEPAERAAMKRAVGL